MHNLWSVIAIVSGSEEELRRIYGDDAVVSRVGRLNLVHLDRPKPEELKQRTDAFDAHEIFQDDCPLCRMLRRKGAPKLWCDLFAKDGQESL